MYTAILAGFKRGIGEVYTQAVYVAIKWIWAALIALIFYHVWANAVEDPERTLAYIAVAEAFYFSARGNVAWKLEKEYNSGFLDVRLLRPIPLWLQYLSEALGPGIFGYAIAMLFLGVFLYAYRGIVLNPITVVLAYPLYVLARTLLYFSIGSLVVDLGRTKVLRWSVSRLDMLTILVPAEIAGKLTYVILPNAYIFYWPGRFAVSGTLPIFWWIGLLTLFICALISENHIRRKIEVFGG